MDYWSKTEDSGTTQEITSLTSTLSPHRWKEWREGGGGRVGLVLEKYDGCFWRSIHYTRYNSSLLENAKDFLHKTSQHQYDYPQTTYETNNYCSKGCCFMIVNSETFRKCKDFLQDFIRHHSISMTIHTPLKKQINYRSNGCWFMTVTSERRSKLYFSSAACWRPKRKKKKKNQ